MAAGRRGNQILRMKPKQKLTLQKSLELFFAFAAIEGVLCLVVLLLIPTDPRSAWLGGYSRSRMMMLGLNLVGILFFAGLLFLQKKSDKALAISNKLEMFLQQDRWRPVVVGLFLLVFIFAVIYLVFAYTNLDYRVPNDAITAMEQVKAYLFRLAPFFIWLALLSGQALILLGLLGFSERAVCHRVLQVLAIAIFPLLFGVFWFFDQIDPFYYVTLTKEDNLVEWLTVFFLILTACLSFAKAFQAFKHRDRRAWFYFLLGVACLFFALEEISWGQRIFGVQSTEFFLENSDQKEINVHNVVNEWFSIRTKHVAAFALFVYGVIVPILALNSRIDALFNKLGFVISPKILIPGFTLAAFMTTDRFFDGQDEEVAELFFSLCLFLLVTFGFVRPSEDNLSSNQYSET